MTCNRCGDCCKSKNFKGMVVIYPNEVSAIAQKLQITSKEFLNEYCNRDSIKGKGYILELYFLKHIKDKCIFLTENNLCNIYAFRPIQCRMAPYNYFANMDIWSHMRCLDETKLSRSNSEVLDKQLVLELLKGYDI